MALMVKRDNDDQVLSDLELIKRVAEGDIRAQELLYRRYFSFAMSVCVRYTGDEHEAMEIVNDSYMKVLEKTGEFDTSKPFRPWYGKILVNSAIDKYRKKLKRLSYLSEDGITATEEHEPEIDAELSAADILALFSRLPDQYRVTFNLSEIEGYSHEEIGNMLGIAASTSRANLSRARRMLRELYNRQFNTAKRSNEAV
jgi:RNA polymerase sigma factor (sigma-70 family)